MPKEIIHAKNHGQVVTDLDSGERTVLPAPTHAHVGWSKEPVGHVELGVLRNTDCVPAEGYFVHLDRDGINRVIRALRKARDDAFGRDE